jgi:hypothetical protein
MQLIPDDVARIVREVPKMPHKQYLEFMSGMMFYASGIYGSYEYVVMESALLGCGLVSLFDAVWRFHRDRASAFEYKGEDEISEKMSEAIRVFDQTEIISTAKALYPIEAVSEIPNILRGVF